MRGAAVVSVLLATLAALPSSATATDGTIQLINPAPLAQPPIRGTYQTMGKGKGKGSSSGKGSASGKGKGSKQTHQLDGKKTITFATGDTYTKTTFVVDDNDRHYDEPKDAGNACGDSCVDNVDFVSSMGLQCRGHTAFECALFAQVGFTEEEVEELIASCPCSCQACPTVARTHTLSLSPIKTPSSSSTTAPVSSRPTSPSKTNEPGVKEDDVEAVAASEGSFWNTSISSTNEASKFSPLIMVLVVVFAAAMFRLGQKLFQKRSTINSGPGMAVISVSRKRRRAKVKDAKGASEAEIQNASTYYSSTAKTSTQVANDEESSRPSIGTAAMTVTEDATITEHYV